MPPRWERSTTPPPATGAKLVLDTVVRPHRSLSAEAFKVMLVAVVMVNVGVALVFWLHHAYPVAGFAGLDVLALWVAFRINYRAAKAEEHVRIDVEQIHVERRNPNGTSVHWIASPLWARAKADNLGVSIRTGGASLRVGSFLSPEQRAAFYRELDNALWRAKRGG
jgi:uncharacterized membrane protein